MYSIIILLNDIDFFLIAYFLFNNDTESAFKMLCRTSLSFLCFIRVYSLLVD